MFQSTESPLDLAMIAFELIKTSIESIEVSSLRDENLNLILSPTLNFDPLFGRSVFTTLLILGLAFFSVFVVCITAYHQRRKYNEQ